MIKLGTIDNIPIYIVDQRKDIFDYVDDNIYFIYKEKVYYHGKLQGYYNEDENSVSWQRDIDVPFAQTSSYTTGWEEMLKPVDDIINEMLRREL